MHIIYSEKIAIVTILQTTARHRELKCRPSGIANQLVHGRSDRWPNSVETTDFRCWYRLNRPQRPVIMLWLWFLSHSFLGIFKVERAYPISNSKLKLNSLFRIHLNSSNYARIFCDSNTKIVIVHVFVQMKMCFTTESDFPRKTSVRFVSC